MEKNKKNKKKNKMKKKKKKKGGERGHLYDVKKGLSKTDKWKPRTSGKRKRRKRGREGGEGMTSENRKFERARNSTHTQSRSEPTTILSIG